MLKYVLKRILMVIPVMIGVSIIVFALMRVFSPDPAPIVLGQHATQEQMDAWREGNGLNEPIVKQYLTYVKDALQGDLGTSYYTNTPVSEEIGARFPATIELALAAITFASIVGVTLGVIAAVKKNSIFDAGGTLIALIGVSIPIFWLGIMFIMFFSGYLHLLPSGGRINVLLEPTDVTGFYMIDALLEGNYGGVPGRAHPPHPPGAHARDVLHGHHHPHDALEHARDAGPGLRSDRARQGPHRAARSSASTRCATRSSP